MLRWAAGLVLSALLAACRGHVPTASPPPTTPPVPTPAPATAPPDEPTPFIPFGVLPEITDIDVYPNGEKKDLEVGRLMRRTTPRPGALVLPKVPLDRFFPDAADAVFQELQVPYDAAVFWRPSSSDASIESVVVAARILVDDYDIDTATVVPPIDAPATAAQRHMTKRELAHAGVHVTVRKDARARLDELAGKHPGHPLVVGYLGWAGGFAEAGKDDDAFELRFSWLSEEAAQRTARDFVARVASRPPQR
jgi:hypothetical protein